MKEIAPYDFVTRKDVPKKEPQAFHDRLDQGRCDIAFEVEWTTETATALNPCTDETQNKHIFGKDGEYAGYNNRWLMFGNRPAISPFTVKSAVANAFAVVLGGCLRVMDDHKIAKHADVKAGVYPYNGVWKRYRVARDGSSKPGIVLERKDQADGSRYFKIQPVKEYYWDRALPSLPGIKHWVPGKKVFATRIRERGHKPPIIEELSLTRKNPNDIEVEYQGACDPDMYTNRRHHQHRFVKRNSGVMEGVLRKEQFESLNHLKNKVYVGSFNNQGQPWFQDLSNIDKTDFVYYEVFNGKIAHIGKNFLFKALFHHSDAVPDGKEACRDKNRLCPRCAMFGMTATEDDNSEAVGFRGRFKVAALVCDTAVEVASAGAKVPVKVKDDNPGAGATAFRDVSFLAWRHDGQEIGRQFLLPIMGPPKPNKRDVNGYFNPQTGMVKGAKRYHHGAMSFEELRRFIAETDRGGQKQVSEEYAHHLRPCAFVAKEGLVFKGVLGAENCDIDEAAALVAILHTDALGHAFKIGLGKALGMGSVRSVIRRIWVRRPDTYQWQVAAVTDKPEKALEALLPTDQQRELTKALNTLRTVRDKLNLLDGDWRNRKLAFPLAGLSYWRDYYNPAGPRTDTDRRSSTQGGDWGNWRSGGRDGNRYWRNYKNMER